MTFTEYQNQKDPVKMPHVILEAGEFRIGHTIKSVDKTVTQVFVDAYKACYLVEGVKGKYVSPNLKTQDKHGNPQKSSCFNLSQTECDKLMASIQATK